MGSDLRYFGPFTESSLHASQIHFLKEILLDFKIGVKINNKNSNGSKVNYNNALKVANN